MGRAAEGAKGGTRAAVVFRRSVGERSVRSRLKPGGHRARGSQAGQLLTVTEYMSTHGTREP